MEPLTWILIIVGCGLFLQGCSGPDRSDEIVLPVSEIPIDDIEETLNSAEDDDSPANSNMLLKCTSGGDKTISLIDASGNPIQKGMSVTGLDTNIGKEGFINCSTSQDKKCIPDIEGDQWQCTDKSHTSNGCDAVTCTSFMFCLYGYGIIYVHKDGQEEGEMKAFGAFYVMELWLREGYDTISEERLNQALEDARNYGDKKRLRILHPVSQMIQNLTHQFWHGQTFGMQDKLKN